MILWQAKFSPGNTVSTLSLTYPAAAVAAATGGSAVVFVPARLPSEKARFSKTTQNCQRQLLLSLQCTDLII